MTSTKKQPDLQVCERCGRGGFYVGQSQCAFCGESLPQPEGEPVGVWSLPEMRYQTLYVWLVFLAAMDILMTLIVLFGWMGYEANPLAAAVIHQMGFGATIAFKFATILLVIVICEWVGRKRNELGRGLALSAVLVHAMVVGYSFALLLRAGPAPTE